MRMSLLVPLGVYMGGGSIKVSLQVVYGSQVLREHSKNIMKNGTLEAPTCDRHVGDNLWSDEEHGLRDVQRQQSVAKAVDFVVPVSTR
jgi:hypothetical protein